ncbi:hypothetical protein HO173_009979 [Letharia columbiana]|uniref:DUF7730 domain-containing protein n=1 Tax=Letharia columbiana TaxID=112416 RepID=A0A8H6FNP6_9LECA|nr:uncharacterized protein HO173_009979 [Letharia columbiana]KAF6231896.1 hypothetical protein HO173_009979 [Letharia columbiana]
MLYSNLLKGPFSIAQDPTVTHVASILATIAVADYKKQPPVGYFSLPAEIRDMIMELVFVQGSMILDSKSPVKRERKASLLQGAVHRVMKTVDRHGGHEDSKPPRVLQPPGFQFLATCRQACAEGHAAFYSSNVFDLLPGPLSNTLRGLKALQPQHLAIIKRVGLTIGSLDLTPAIRERVHQELRVRYGAAWTDGPSLARSIRWSTRVEWRLKCLWRAKLDFILTQWEGLTVLKITNAEKSLELDADDVAKTVEFLEGMNGDIFRSLEIRELVWRAEELVQEEVQDMIETDGWKALEAEVEKIASGMSD